MLQFVGVVLMREPVARTPGALRSMRPEIAIPRAARVAVLAAAPAIVASWALPSFYASLGPALVARLSGSSSLLLGGVPLFLLAVSAVPAVLATRQLPASSVMTAGSGAIAVGVGGAVVAAAAGSTSRVLRAPPWSPAAGSARPSRARCAPSCPWRGRTSGRGCSRCCT